MRIGTVAVGLGVATGLWTLFAVLGGYLGRQPCLPGLATCGGVTLEGTALEALGVVLILDSLACIVGPKKIFYTSALLAAVIGAMALLGTGDAVSLVLTLGLAFADFALSIQAARSEPRLSEQSNPMNLPVFG